MINMGDDTEVPDLPPASVWARRICACCSDVRGWAQNLREVVRSYRPIVVGVWLVEHGKSRTVATPRSIPLPALRLGEGTHRRVAFFQSSIGRPGACGAIDMARPSSPRSVSRIVRIRAIIGSRSPRYLRQSSVGDPEITPASIPAHPGVARDRCSRRTRQSPWSRPSTQSVLLRSPGQWPRRNSG